MESLACGHCGRNTSFESNDMTKDNAMHDPQKACLIVLRNRDGRTDVLAFRHPTAGIQLVKGTIKPGEAAEDAARRELAEESGVIIRGDLLPVGPVLIGDPPSVWHMFLTRIDDLPDQWTHATTDDHGHVFAFFWHPLRDAPGSEWGVAYRAVLGRIIGFSGGRGDP